MLTNSIQLSKIITNSNINHEISFTDNTFQNPDTQNPTPEKFNQNEKILTEVENHKDENKQMDELNKNQSYTRYFVSYTIIIILKFYVFRLTKTEIINKLRAKDEDLVYDPDEYCEKDYEESKYTYYEINDLSTPGRLFLFKITTK